MKIKYLIITAIIAVTCAFCCSCNKGQQTSESESLSQSQSEIEQVSIKEEIIPQISVSQSSVTLGIGSTFTLSASASNVENALFTWALDGESKEGIVTLVQNGNAVKVTAVTVGEVNLVAYLVYEGHTYYKKVPVAVKQTGDVTLMLSDNVGFNENGYYVSLATMQATSSDVTSIVPIVTAYKNNTIVTSSAMVWSIAEGEDVISINGNTWSSLKEGTAKVVGSCLVEDETYTVNVLVEVYRPIIEISEHYTVEVEALEALPVTSSIKGVSSGVVYNGVTVGSYNSQDKSITLNKNALPVSATELGEGRRLTIETNLASYVFTADLYTKVIREKADFDKIGDLSKACSQDEAIWDGYFILGDDIEYNGLFKSNIADMGSLWSAVEGNWHLGSLYGFKGVIDGKGHKVEGIEIDNGNQMASIVGVLHVNGVIKNLSFTNASVGANSSLVCGAGGGSVENIYIQYKSIGNGVQKYEGDGSINTHTASFFGFKEPIVTANVSNCIIDLTEADIATNSSIKAVGVEYATIKNVFVIGGSEDVRAKSNATMSFASVIEFVEDANAQTRFSKFDERYWLVENGAPISRVIYNDVKDLAVNFTKEVSCLMVGTEYRFVVDNKYATITIDCDGITVKGGIATLSDSVEIEKAVNVTAISMFNQNIKDSFTFTVKDLDVTTLVDLTAEKPAFYDLTVDEVYLADLKKHEALEGVDILYYVNNQLKTVSFAQGVEEMTTVIGVAENGLYKIVCETVTKVISTKEDLHYVRRNKTVESYGNKGCYDGVITGKFVLINDIDCEGLVLEDSGTYWENSRGFGGLFDGRGYSIKNLSVSKNGLFGTLSYATIINVDFEDVKLKAFEESGVYVALFAGSVYNTKIDNVNISFAEYVGGIDGSGCSGLMFYEKTFDSVFTSVTLDISNISSVQFLTECNYNAAVPFGSVDKSTYSNITVIVASEEEIPAFAYGSTVIEYPDGFTFKDKDGNVLQNA